MKSAQSGFSTLKMFFKNKLNIVLAVFVLSVSLFSCRTIIPGDEDIVVPIVNKGIGTVPDSIKGLLAFHENFQQWKRDGYLLQIKQDCETDLMRSTGLVSYMYTQVPVIYDTLKVNYSLMDFAVNPECGAKDGTSTDSSEISTGYVALQCPLLYTCGHYSKGYFETSTIPSVSYVEFTVSYGDNSGTNYAAGVSLWRKGDLDTDTVKIGTYIPTNPLKGEKFTVKINSKNVFLRFKAEKNSNLTIVMESNINRSIRIHDLYIWKPGTFN
jgi:hypothetical protein